ncbi:hypothetical protein ACLMJK_000806 [Lecanora helva]
MATADASGHVIDPAPISTWSHIETQTLKVSRHCIGGKEGGGLVLIADPVGPGALTAYMYAVGSPFEAVLNNYMITSQPLHPPATVSQGTNTSFIWLADNGTLVSPPDWGTRLLQSS